MKDAVLLDTVRVLCSQRRKARVKTAAIEALQELRNLGLGAVTAPSECQEVANTLLRGETSLAEYPYATLLTSVSDEFHIGVGDSFSKLCTH